MRCARMACGLLAVVLAAAPALAATDGPGRPGYGKTLAREMCGECHIVAPDQTRGGADPLAPDLVERVQDTGITELALRAYLQTSHPIMPNVRLTPEQTDDIVAYLLSLKGKKP